MPAMKPWGHEGSNWLSCVAPFLCYPFWVLQPVFVKGNVRFELEGRRLEFLQQNISHLGVSGLPWGELKATEHFGARVRCDVTLNLAEGQPFSADAHIIREYTTTTETMGLKFDLPPGQLKTVTELVQKHARPSHRPLSSSTSSRWSLTLST
jgi:hypothetical protein